jgi:feruloyl esterase
VSEFGLNPGSLEMFKHVPADLPPGAPLVVVLHGCTQNAADYDRATGWSTLADERGFALAFPQQRMANNSNLCFNWFDPSQAARSGHEVRSIVAMIEHMVTCHSIDRRRIFVCGLSAGGAMTSALLATHPELFAGGAIFSGLPFGAAHNLQEAFETMFQGRVRSAREWGELVRTASSHSDPWPKVSIWHGSADPVVKPDNAEELVKQWTNVHGVRQSETKEVDLAGFSRRQWRGPDGAVLVESYIVRGMGHGTPLDTALDGSRHLPGPFMLDVGISSTRITAEGWGLLAGGLPRREGRADRSGEQKKWSEPRREQAATDHQAGTVAQLIEKALRQAGLRR